jgi:hypothetical protein
MSSSILFLGLLAGCYLVGCFDSKKTGDGLEGELQDLPRQAHEVNVEHDVVNIVNSSGGDIPSHDHLDSDVVGENAITLPPVDENNDSDILSAILPQELTDDALDPTTTYVVNNSSLLNKDISERLPSTPLDEMPLVNNTKNIVDLKEGKPRVEPLNKALSLNGTLSRVPLIG